ncbi:MAG: serine/threonine protein kinase [Proteobacteria bacterium]|nr:serine/threonine protein kinase [Pseudomonadota bacterium]
MSHDKWQKLSNDLTDGKDIDWSKQTELSPEDLIFLEQLNTIDRITKFFEHNAGTKFKVKNKEFSRSQKPQLFAWGHLQVIEKIGEGSFGEVYKAYDPILDIDVALKLFKQKELLSIKSGSFIEEAKRLAKVRHENVLAVHGANVFGQQIGMWSDLINGNNLSEAKFQHPFKSTMILELIASLCEALTAVHKAGLIHGDIKPSNVMKQIDDGKYILMDFGTGAQREEKQDFHKVLTGTPLFMAPELFKNHSISPASDVYALGVLLFKLASTKYPIKSKNLADIHAAHEQKKYRTIDKLRKDLPKSLRLLINQMLSFDPINRPTAKTIDNKVKWIISAPQRRNKRLVILLIFSTLVLGMLATSVGFYRAKKAQELAIIEKEKAQSVNEFLQDMLSAASALGKGKEVKIIDMLDFAVRDLNNKFIDKPHIKATTLHAIARSYASLQTPKLSLELYTQSLKIKKQWLTADSPEILRTMLGMAYSHQLLGNVQQSDEILNQMLKLASKNQKKKQTTY